MRSRFNPLTVDAATRDEVLTKTDLQINIETAYKWAARAVVAYNQFSKTGEVEWLIRGEDYRHEALEHAAVSGENGDLVTMLRDSIDRFRPKYSGDI